MKKVSMATFFPPIFIYLFFVPDCRLFMEVIGGELNASSFLDKKVIISCPHKPFPLLHYSQR